MKSRLAITMILALGLFMSLGGVGLAVSGVSDSGDAASVQYSEDPGDDSSTSTTTTTLSDPSDPSDPGEVQAAAQESSDGDDTLPFTGFAAIPVLIGGLALLSSGLVLRRRTRR